MSLGVKTGKSISFKDPIPPAKIINVPQVAQEQTNWCWAACLEMVLHYYDDPAVQQCELALVVVRGWHITETEEFLHVNDPKDSNGASRIVAYSELLDAYGDGRWMYTWLEIRR